MGNGNKVPFRRTTAVRTGIKACIRGILTALGKVGGHQAESPGLQGLRGVITGELPPGELSQAQLGFGSHQVF